MKPMTIFLASYTLAALAPAAHAQTIHVRVRANEPGLTLHRVTAEHGLVYSSRGGADVSFEPICTAPCDATIEPGSMRLAVSRHDPGVRVLVDGYRDIRSDSSLSLHYESHEAEQIAGALALVIGPIAASGMLLGGVLSMQNAQTDLGYGLLVAAPTLFVASIVVAIAFLAKGEDVARIDVEPPRF